MAELPGASTEVLADPFADDDRPDDWRPEWPAEAWHPEPVAEPFPPAPAIAEEAADRQVPDQADADIEYPMWQPDPEPVPARALPPDAPGEMENADTQLMGPPNSAPRAETGVSEDSLIMAVVCQYGHAERRRTPPPAGSVAARSLRRARSSFLGRCWRCCAPLTAPRPRSTGPC